jgi:hypothetical protein
MTKYLFILLVLLYICGCVPSFDTPPVVIKEIKDDSVTVQWLGRSTAFAEVPDIVIAKSGEQVDTLCIAQNIADIAFYKNPLEEVSSIRIGFLDAPRKYGESTEVKDKSFGYDVLTDGNYHEVYHKGHVNERKIYHGGIINKDASSWLIFDEAEQRYTATEEDVADAERILRENLSYIKDNRQDFSYSIPDNPDNYLRQYVGFINKDGEKGIWINFLCNDETINTLSLHKNIITVDDGGSCHWSVKVNIAKRKLYDMND